MKRILPLLFVLFSTLTFAQVGVNTTNPDPSSMLDISATNKGVLVPRVSLANVTTTMLDGTNTAATGLLIWNTNAATVGGNGVGFYFFNGTQWIPITQTATSDHDIYEVGGTTAPDSITDNKYTQGSLTIGTNTAATGVLDVDNATKTTSVDVTNTFVINPIGIDLSLTSANSTKTGVKTTFNGSSASGNNTFISNIDNTTGNSNRNGILQEFNGTSSSIATTIRGVKNDFKSTANYYAVVYGFENSFADNSNSFKYGLTNNFLNGGSSQSTGVLNNFNGTSTGIAYGVYNASNNYNGLMYGMQNIFSGTGNNDHFGMFNYFDGTGTGNKYGVYNNFPTTAGGTHYGIYSNVQKSGSFAGYFLGNVSIGSNVLNNYILPTSRGTNGQIMQTDGSGNVSWVTPAITDTDDQATDIFSLTGDTLNLSLQNDGVATQTVDLSPLKDHDWYEVGGTTAPNAITDNKYTQGTVTIGTNTAATGVLDIDNATKATSLDINNTYVSNPVGLNIDINSISGTKTGINVTQNGTYAGYGGVGSMVSAIDNGSGNYNRFALYNVFNGTSTDSSVSSYGMRNAFTANSFLGDFIGVANYDFSNSNGDRYGVVNSSFSTGNGINYGIYNSFSGTGIGNKYGVYNSILSTAGGTHYGIYSNVLKTGSYAGYFLGNLSVGTTTANNYIFPASRGTNGQIMQTDGSGNVSWVTPTVVTDTDDQTTDVFSLIGDTLNLSLQNDGVATQTVDLSPLKDHDWYEIGTTSAPNAITDNIFTQGNVAIGKNTIGPDTRVDIDNPNKTTSLTLSNTYDIPASESPKYGIYNTLNSVEQQTAIKNDLLGNGSFKVGVDNLFQGVMSSGSGSGINTRFETTGGANQFGVYNTFASTSSTGTTINGMRNWFQSGSGYTSFLTGIANDFNNNNNGEHTAIANTFTGTGTGTKYGVKNTYTGTSVAQFYGSYTNATSGSGTIYGAYNNLSVQGNRYGVYNNLNSTGFGLSYGTYNKINNTGGTTGVHYGVYNEMLAFDNQYGTYTTMPSVTNYPQYGNYVTIAGSGTGNRYGFYSTISPFAGGIHYGVYSEATKAGSFAGYFLGDVSIGTSAFNSYILPASKGTNGQIMQTDGLGNVSWATPSIGGSLDDAYDFGGAGAGRNITADSGAVTISGTDGLVSTGTFGSGVLAPTGSGTRMVWNPRKGAFRAGFVSSTQWNDPNIGQYSFAFGYDTMALGAYSAAFGSGSTATGVTATAFGDSTSSGIASTSFGTSSAIGGFATAFGSSTASGSSATSFGTSNASAQYATAFGSSTASGIAATSYGTSSATGDYATAMGTTSTADGANTFAFGNSSQSIGIGSFAGGFTSIANNNYSSAIGLQCVTNGDDSFAGGSKSVTYAKAATAFGRENNAQSYGETVLGIGATNYTPSAGGTINFRAANVTDRLFVIGNALDANNNSIVDAAERSDALVILKNGETGLGMNPVTGSRLAVSGKTQTTNFQMTSGAFGGYILQSDATGNATWINPTTLSPPQWKIGGNSGTTSGTDYIGTNDAQDLDFRTNGILKLRLTQQGQLSFQNSGGSVFVGAGAGNSDDLSANQNTFVGTNSGTLTTTGNLNTAVGHFALDANTTGVGNTAIGRASLATNDLGNNNTALGRLTDVSTGSLTNATVIGYNATVNASNKVRLGSTVVTVVEGQVAYTNPSDARFKFNVKENVPGLDFIKKLKPVTYNFDTKKFENHLNPNRKEEIANIDYSKSTAIIHTGFLAQDVEKICNDLGYDFDGLHIPDANNPTDNYGVAYSQFIMPIVKAVQEQQVIIEKQKTELEQLKSELEKYKSLDERIKALENK